MAWANSKITNMMNSVSSAIETKGMAMLQKTSIMQDDFMARYKKLLDQVGGVKTETKDTSLPSKHRPEFSYTAPTQKYLATTPAPPNTQSSTPSVPVEAASFESLISRPARALPTPASQPINTRPPRTFEAVTPKPPPPKPLKTPTPKQEANIPPPR